MKVSELSSELRCVAAKTNHRKGSDSKEPRLWLPFWMHALDIWYRTGSRPPSKKRSSLTAGIGSCPCADFWRLSTILAK